MMILLYSFAALLALAVMIAGVAAVITTIVVWLQRPAVAVALPSPLP